MMAKVNRSLIELILYSGVGLDLKLLKRTEKCEASFKSGTESGGEAFEEDRTVGTNFRTGPESGAKAY